MNFGYPFTPYAANMGQEQYMGNVGTNPNMANMGMDYMPQQAMGSGCGCGAQTMDYMAQQPMAYGMQCMGFGQPGCNQVVQQTCAVDIPYYVNYNTHVVNNVVRRHIQIPVYSQTQQTVYFDEWQTSCCCNR